MAGAALRGAAGCLRQLLLARAGSGFGGGGALAASFARLQSTVTSTSSEPATLHDPGNDAVHLRDNWCFVASEQRSTSPVQYQGRNEVSSFENVPKLAILRDIFTPSGEDGLRSAYEVLRKLDENTVAVLASATSPARRLLVDEYIRHGKEQYTLQQQGVDLIRYLRKNGFKVIMEPDEDALGARAENRAPVFEARQSTNQVLMVAPTAFQSNEQAAQDNYYMDTSVGFSRIELRRRVLAEYAQLHHVLTEDAGVQVNLFAHEEYHNAPDSVFPNNWFSTHIGEGNLGSGQGRLVLYPFKVPNRRNERRADMIDYLKSFGRYSEVLDLTGAEQQSTPQFLEGTGSLVLDRQRGIAYVAVSERSDAQAAEQWAEKMGYSEVVSFMATDSKGLPIYHTNVMMAIGTSVAVVCLESVEDPVERQHLLSRLQASHEVVNITRQQATHFCGNVIELRDGRDLPILALSTAAYNAFTADQKKTLRKHLAALHHAPIDTLERVGGGGVRCAIAEVF
eukprot:jgi/Chlat1/2192/Chrsp17S02756